MSARAGLALCLALAALGCDRGDPPGDDDDTAQATPPLVVMITIDALNRGFLGATHPWDTTPGIDALAAEGTTLHDVLVSRGLTSPSMGSLLTGLYPRDHGVRSNVTAWDGSLPTLPRWFQQAGFTTWGYSANMCSFIDHDIDHRMCSWLVEMPELTSQREGDELLVDQLLADLADRGEGPHFVWLHLMDPHDPYTAVEPWYAQFHPDPYAGTFDPADHDDLDAVMFGDRELDEADLLHLDAVYASSVRSTDELVARFFDGLRDLELYEGAVVVLGADHGEVLARHADYFYHGCSTHNAELAVTWIVRAPGAIPAGAVLDGWVGEVDLAPTLLALAGLEVDASLSGRSLVPDLEGGAIAEGHDRYFERGTRTAGMIRGDTKYVLNPVGDFHDCFPYEVEGVPFPGDTEMLYDLVADPQETTNLADTAEAEAAELRGALCAWVLEDTWTAPEADASNALVAACQP